MSGCSIINKQESEESTSRYNYLIDMLKEHSNFASSSSYFDIDVEMASINGGYRYYVIIDNPKLAMYDIELLAIEPEKDYSQTMAATVGIFDEKEYHMIPNQANVEEGFVKGLVASGTTDHAEVILRIYVQFKNSDYTTVHNEYIQLACKYEE